MKTTKKGFTLIELIVVIAIIGVLAAILVPSMLGYVKKSKVSGANSAANSLQKAINTALVEIDEESEKAANIHWMYHSGAANANTKVQMAGNNNNTTNNTKSDAEKLWGKINNYIDKIQTCTFYAYCDGGVCQGAAIEKDKTYTGTSPAGIVTVDNYKDYSQGENKGAKKAIEDLVASAKVPAPAAGGNKPSLATSWGDSIPTT